MTCIGACIRSSACIPRPFHYPRVVFSAIPSHDDDRHIRGCNYSSCNRVITKYLISGSLRLAVIIVLTTFLTIVIIGKLAFVNIQITHYCHSTADISQATPTQIFTSLLSLTISTTVPYTWWRNYLSLCKIIKDTPAEISNPNKGNETNKEKKTNTESGRYEYECYGPL